jgi:transcriptional regulator with XRE-family HTH domain
MSKVQLREKILDLRSKGLSYREIADRVGVSRSRVGQIVKREEARQVMDHRSALFLERVRRGNVPSTSQRGFCFTK